jgi:hypothetical protein
MRQPLFLYFYGINKLTGHQLTVPASILQSPIGSLDGETLTWAYFNHSHGYRIILGLIQAVSASLLLFRKTTLLAALVMMPIMANIVLINIFYVITTGALVTSLFITTTMFLILWNQRNAFHAILWASQTTEPKTSNRLHWTIRSVILLWAFTLIAVGTFAFSLLRSFSNDYERQHQHVIAK